jgi:hypothetical protein
MMATVSTSRASARDRIRNAGLDPPTLDNARDLLDLLDPTGEEDEPAVEFAEWADQLVAEGEAREYATSALIECARMR